MKKRVLTVIVATTMIGSLLAGCKPTQVSQNSDKKVSISIGNWAQDNKPTEIEKFNKWLKTYNEKNPNVSVTPDKWHFDINSFLPKAASNQLPTIYNSFFTEASKIIDAGYAADITAYMDKYGYTKKLKPELLNLVSRNGKIYAIPADAYAMGLYVNMNLFKEAGELKEDGTPNFPATYEELAKLAQRIREKTGKAGFVLPTNNNCGGWHFMNIAWSYGAKFMEQKDGKWVATFDSPEGVAALQYVKDLKWKYNALPENAFVDIPEMQKLFATDQAAMFFQAPPANDITGVYKMDKTKIAIGNVPGGPAGRYALMGGNIRMLNPNATPEQIDACFKWLAVEGVGPEVNDDVETSLDMQYTTISKNGYMIGPEKYNIYTDAPRLDAERKVIDKYKNVDLNLFSEYKKFEGISIHPEEQVSCQELYKTLDLCIQAVITDKNADPKSIMSKAASDFQKNYLDHIK